MRLLWKPSRPGSTSFSRRQCTQKSWRQRRSVSQQKAKIRTAVQRTSRKFISQASQELYVQSTTKRRVLHKQLDLTTQELKPVAKPKRLDLTIDMQQQTASIWIPSSSQAPCFLTGLRSTRWKSQSAERTHTEAGKSSHAQTGGPRQPWSQRLVWLNEGQGLWGYFSS
jgi:hypothetical protein